MPESREPRVRGSGHTLPFSKGRIATTLYLSGVGAEHAYDLALEVEQALLVQGVSEIAVEDLHRIGRLPSALASHLNLPDTCTDLGSMSISSSAQEPDRSLRQALCLPW